MKTRSSSQNTIKVQESSIPKLTKKQQANTKKKIQKTKTIKKCKIKKKKTHAKIWKESKTIPEKSSRMRFRTYNNSETLVRRPARHSRANHIEKHSKRKQKRSQVSTHIAPYLASNPVFTANPVINVSHPAITERPMVQDATSKLYKIASIAAPVLASGLFTQYFPGFGLPALPSLSSFVPSFMRTSTDTNNSNRDQDLENREQQREHEHEPVHIHVHDHDHDRDHDRENEQEHVHKLPELFRVFEESPCTQEETMQDTGQNDDSIQGESWWSRFNPLNIATGIVGATLLRKRAAGRKRRMRMRKATKHTRKLSTNDIVMLQSFQQPKAKPRKKTPVKKGPGFPAIVRTKERPTWLDMLVNVKQKHHVPNIRAQEQPSRECERKVEEQQPQPSFEQERTSIEQPQQSPEQEHPSIEELEDDIMNMLENMQPRTIDKPLHDLLQRDFKRNRSEPYWWEDMTS